MGIPLIISIKLLHTEKNSAFINIFLATLYQHLHITFIDLVGVNVIAKGQ